MHRHSALAAAVACAAVVATVPSAALAAASATQCSVSGQSRPSPGLRLTAGPYTATAHASVSGCQGGIPAGTLTVGEPVTIGGIAYLPPDPAAGSGGCLYGTGSGTGIVRWADGGVTVVFYSTYQAGPVQAFRGSVLDGIALTRADGTGIVDTVATTRFAGDGVVADTTWTPDAAACAGAGLTTQPWSGSLDFTTTG
jgi:hypothetical protein